MNYKNNNNKIDTDNILKRNSLDNDKYKTYFNVLSLSEACPLTYRLIFR